jgi:c-di-GMP-binding flagellar brake protein YcgR
MKEIDNRCRFGLANFERRKYPRFLINLPIEYIRLDQSQICSGQGVDLSEGGLLLHVSDDMDIGQHLKISLFIDADSGIKPIEVKGTVVWKDCKLGKDGFQRIGFNFLEITPAHRQALKSFLNNLSEMTSRFKPIFPGTFPK